MTWNTVPGKYVQHQTEVIRLCTTYLGPPHKYGFNKKTLRFYDNHGNWRLTVSGNMQLRYKKDIAWFLLFAGNLADDPTPKFGNWPGPR